VTLNDREWPCYVNLSFVFVNSCSEFTYIESVIISILGIDNIFDECYVYKLEVYTELLNILRLEIFNSFGLPKSI